MVSSKFWNANSSTTTIGVNGSKKGKGLIKGLGITGVILMVVIAIVGIVAYNYIISPAYALLSAVNSVQSSGNKVANDLKNRDLVTLDADLKTLESNLNNLRSERDKKFGCRNFSRSLCGI